VNPEHEGARVQLARMHLSREDFGPAARRRSARCGVNPASLERSRSWRPRSSSRRPRGLRRHAPPRARAESPLVRPRRHRVRAGGPGAPLRGGGGARPLRGGARLRGLARLGPPGHEPAPHRRLGEGRESLERAFGGDPYNPWLKNSLDLLEPSTASRPSAPSTSSCSCTAPRRTSWGPGLGARRGGVRFALVPLRHRASTPRARGALPPATRLLRAHPRRAGASARSGVSFGSLLVMDSPRRAPRASTTGRPSSGTSWPTRSPRDGPTTASRGGHEGLAGTSSTRPASGGTPADGPFLKGVLDGRLKR